MTWIYSTCVSAGSIIFAMARTDYTGQSPAAVSLENIMAEVPSYTALGTAEISALVGLGLRIIDSNIFVTVITRFPWIFH